jgi:hypothetical protein
MSAANAANEMNPFNLPSGSAANAALGRHLFSLLVKSSLKSAANAAFKMSFLILSRKRIFIFPLYKAIT